MNVNSGRRSHLAWFFYATSKKLEGHIASGPFDTLFDA